MNAEAPIDHASAPFAGRRLMVVVAHPDDEVLFAGGQFSTCAQLGIVHVTDGAPSIRVARAKGFASLDAYAEARRTELQAALDVAGLTASYRNLGYRDQLASFHMPAIAKDLVKTIGEWTPDIVLTHAYEGGHMDHDATAFAVAAATRHRPDGLQVWEMACYHRQDGRPVQGSFPRDRFGPGRVLTLSAEAEAVKRRMLACFASQAALIGAFPTGHECVRPAPPHDFTRAPVDEPLNYESEVWGMQGRHWRALAAASTEALEGQGRPLRDRLLRAAVSYARWARRRRSDHPSVARLIPG
jgi:N-acetylglucosamine malate deacetylase 2